MKIVFVANTSPPGAFQIMARNPVEVSVLRQFMQDQRPICLVEDHEGQPSDANIAILLQHVDASSNPPHE